MSGFDPETWLHSLEYDDGDVEPAIRLWREVCHLGVPEDTRADEENATREAKRRKVAETEIAEAKKQLEAAEAERDRLELSREMADDDEADDDEADDKADDEASPAASPAADAGGSSVPTTPAQTMTTRSVKELCQLRMSMSSAGILGVGPGAGTGGRGGTGAARQGPRRGPRTKEMIDDERTHARKKERTNKRTHARKNACTKERTHARTNEHGTTTRHESQT